jgi:cytochrome P460
MKYLARRPAVLLAFLLISVASPLFAQDKPMVSYPEGYRAWRVIKVRIVGPENNLFATRGGIHLFFANDKAVEGFRAKHFADGAVLVEEIVQTKESDGAFKGSQVEGARVSIDVKVKNDALFKDTGGWGYDTFKGDDKVSALNDQIRSRCFACHASQKDRDFTFSEMRQ